MRWLATFVCLATIAACYGFGKRGVYEGYQLLSVVPTTEAQVRHVYKLHLEDPQLDFWSEARKINQKARILVSPDKVYDVVEGLRSAGLRAVVEHDNIERVVAEEMEALGNRRSSIAASAAVYNYTEYYPYNEVMDEIENMKGRCPTGHLCETYVIGQTYEGRDLKMFRIYKEEANRKAYWIDSLIHAREWLAIATHMKIVDHILTNYDSDPEVKSFLDRGDYYFLFLHNPDGYAYSWDSERLWRKNMFNNSLVRETTCMGIDLNRNYLHRWGNAGNTDNPCGSTYRGIRPASELETQSVQTEVLRIASEQTIESFVTIHTAAKMILTPWGSVLDPGTELQCEFTEIEEHTEVMKVANAMKKAIEETHNDHEWIAGNSCDAIYPASGLTQDFARGLAGVMFSFTLELRDQNARGIYYGFRAPSTEIQPSFEELWNGLVAKFAAIDDYNLRVQPTSPPVQPTCPPVQPTCPPVQPSCPPTNRAFLLIGEITVLLGAIALSGLVMR